MKMKRNHFLLFANWIIGRLLIVSGLRNWSVQLKVNWAWLIFAAFMLAYGYFGALSPIYTGYKDGFAQQLGIMALLAAIEIGIGYIAWKKANRFEDSFTVTGKDLLTFIATTLFLLCLCYPQLQHSLYSDELSYSGSAHAHAIYISLRFASYMPVLGAAKAQQVIQVISATLIIALMAVSSYSLKLTPKFRITLWLLLLLIVRIVFAVKGGNGSPHPPLHLMPMLLTSTILGITDMSFKATYLLTYSIFLTIMSKMLRRIYTDHLAFVMTLTIGTIPLLLNLSTVVEHSIWGFICYTLVLTEITTKSKINYFRLISMISIASLMRQPAFLALVPVLLLLVCERLNTGSIVKEIKSLWVAFTPVVLFLPFLFSSLVQGTPSTEALGEASILHRVWDALKDGIVTNSVASSLPVWWVACIPFAFLPLSTKNTKINLALLLFGLSSIVVYYAINPTLWGYAKYQAEYAAPLAIAGFFLVIRFCDFHHIGKSLKLAIAVVVLVLNTYSFENQKQTRRAAEGKLVIGKEKVLESSDLRSLYSSLPYEYKKAYQIIKQNGLDGETYSVSSTYGVLPEIMNGYDIDATVASWEIYARQANNDAKNNMAQVVKKIADDHSINAVIIGAVPGKAAMIEMLSRIGWETISILSNKDFNTSLTIMRRPLPLTLPSV